MLWCDEAESDLTRSVHRPSILRHTADGSIVLTESDALRHHWFVVAETADAVDPSSPNTR